MDMMRIYKLLALCVGLTFLVACGAQEGKPVTFFEGDPNSFQLQVGCSSVMDGAACGAATRDSKGNIFLQGTQLKDSTAGKVTTGLAVSLPNKAVDYAMARDLTDRAKCKGDGCGGNTYNLAGGAAQAVSQNESRVEGTVQTDCANCDAQRKLPSSF
jgi:hypothetical protein